MIVLWSKLSLFWRFQIIGWIVFVGATFPAKLMACGNLPDAIGSLFLRDGVSVGLTLIMRVIYRRIYRTHQTPVWILGSIFIVSGAAALLQLPPYYWMGELFPYEEKTIFGPYAVFGIVVFRGGQFLGWSLLYFSIKIWLERQASIHKLERERGMRERIELQMLRSLANTHFLCNSLNTIQTILDRQKHGASEMIQALSSYLHYSLKHRWDNVVALGEEIEALENYLAIQRARLGSSLDFAMQVATGLAKALVPGFVLQPLVENAIKYGLKDGTHQVSVRVLIQRESDTLVIKVLNTGHWSTPDPYRQSGGVGLETIQRKFLWLYPNQHSLITFEEEGWVTVEIKIPLSYDS
jgi:two-component sensor histidine kinase